MIMGDNFMALVPAKCTQCGANIDVDNQRDAAICPFCGTAYIVEKAINSFIINSENTISLNRMIQNIDTFIELKSWERATEVIEEVIRNYPEDYRGWWRKVVVETCNFSTNIITKDTRENYAIAYKLANEYSKALIKLTFIKYELQCKEVKNKLQIEREKGVENAKYCNQYRITDVENALDVKIPLTKRAIYPDIDYHFHSFTYIYGNIVEFKRYREYNSLNDQDKLYKRRVYIDDSTTCGIYVDDNIAELLSGYETNGKQACYIATCVYGSYDCPQVWTLRRFRDHILDKTWYGKVFIRCYYSLSPTIVRWFGEKKWFRFFWRKYLDIIVSKLNSQGIEDTQYDDKY